MATKKRTAKPVDPLVKDLEELIDDQKLRHFKGAEFSEYWDRVVNGVKNSIPPMALWNNILPTLWVADEIRERAGKPLQVLSSYRSPAYNRAVGGVANSEHMRFMALDITGNDGISSQALHAIAQQIRGKHIFPKGNAPWVWSGGLGLYVSSNFIHIDCRTKRADWKQA